ncbi:MAG: bifunctional hydroxymethylpyrimidine kinase/phosphomethylpyrimidine kinase [Proteobacteria bacterium]|nr:bifunctional hydroxymethylpyrimidine kinase/phosphomethylpyrimidine kinase [Pseudomonadota bacterium]MBU1688256.1 bifunctional hydroxymethylpyrimidine kinase/phosphomethylpyrimidine kinase [Pseudomonadota bacterium]
MDHPAAILTIAGSDPSGGAGVQADLKTFATIGVYGCGAITNLTVQNTLGVTQTHPVTPELVKAQIESILTDLPITHIKTGMIGTGEVAGAIGECLAGFNGKIICDPVLKSSSGTPLLPQADLVIFRDEVIARATILTPNLEELAILIGNPQLNQEEIEEAGRHLLSTFPHLKGIVIKGGHAINPSDTVTDLLLLVGKRAGLISIAKATRPRINNSGLHGTGCTFASAFASYHLLTGDYQKAFHQAGEYISTLLKMGVGRQLGHGNSPLQHHLYPRAEK